MFVGVYRVPRQSTFSSSLTCWFTQPAGVRIPHQRHVLLRTGCGWTATSPCVRNSNCGQKFRMTFLYCLLTDCVIPSLHRTPPSLHSNHLLPHLSACSNLRLFRNIQAPSIFVAIANTASLGHCPHYWHTNYKILIRDVYTQITFIIFASIVETYSDNLMPTYFPHNLYIRKTRFSRYRPGLAQRVGRGIALLFHERGTRRGEWSAARPDRTLPPGKSRLPVHMRLDGPQVRSGWMEKLVPTGIRSRTVQPFVSRYTDWATRPLYIYIYITHTYRFIRNDFRRFNNLS